MSGEGEGTEEARKVVLRILTQSTKTKKLQASNKTVDTPKINKTEKVNTIYKSRSYSKN